jgi:hypothetical protein
VYAKPTAPRSIGGVLDDAIKLYREAFTKSWLLALIGQVLIAGPLLVIRLKMAAIPEAAGNPMAAAMNPAAAAALMAVFKSPAIWLSYLLAMIFTFGLYNALIAQADAFAKARQQSIGESFAVGFRLLPCSALLYLVMAVAVMIGAVCVGLVAGLLGVMHVSGIVGSVLGLALFVFGIYAWGRAFLANTALVVENTGVFKSLGISWSLIKNHWWRTATVYGVAIIIAIVFYFLIAGLDGLIFAMLRGSGASATVVSQLLSIATGAVLTPFYPTVLLAMYYDLKLRNEGADLAGRVNALAPQ